MLGNLHWLGHAAFRLDGTKAIYFDPFQLPAGSRPADIIFITHDHFDHFSKDDLGLISSKDTVIVTDGAVAGQIPGAGLAYKEVKALSPNQGMDLGGIKVMAVPSYNTNKSFHTKESKKLGFIVTVDNVSIYDAGDTDNIPEMQGARCDIALLPVSGTYVMTAEEAAEAALVIKPKVAIPMHYGSIVGSDSDAKKFRDLLKDRVEVRILSKE